MTIDKEQLKALALAATQGVWLYDGSTLNDWEAGSYSMEWMPNGEDCEDGANANFKADGAYMAAANPATILELLGEIERLQIDLAEMTGYRDNAANHMLRIRAEATNAEKERDQLKAENEALRKDSARLTWLDESKEIDSVGPTLCCGKHRATLREAIDAAMAMEARHG